MESRKTSNIKYKKCISNQLTKLCPSDLGNEGVMFGSTWCQYCPHHVGIDLINETVVCAGVSLLEEDDNA